MKFYWVIPVALIFAAYIFQIQYFVDDSYIYARLVKHFIKYGVPFWDVSVPFKTGTSSGFLWCLSLLTQITKDPVSSIYIFNASIIFVSIMALYYLCTLCKMRVLQVFLSMLLFLPLFLLAAYRGMDTPAACLMMILGAIALKKTRSSWVVFFLSLAVCFRIEFAFILILFLALELWEKRNFKIIFYAFPLILITIWEYKTYGNLLPVTAMAKRLAYNIPILQNATIAYPKYSDNYYIGYIFFIITACMTVLRLKNFKNSLFLFQGSIIFVSWFIGGIFVFHWYPCLITTSLVLSYILYRNQLDFLYASLTLAYMLALFCTSDDLHYTERSKGYFLMGTGLYEHCPTCTMMATEIGALGYTYKGTVADTLGIANPDVWKYHPLPMPSERRNYLVGAVPSKYIDTMQPDFFVSWSILMESAYTKGALDSYKGYVCRNSRYPMMIFSKKTLPDTLLKSMCHKGYNPIKKEK